MEEGKGASETQPNRASDSARIVSSSFVGKDDMWSSAGLSLESWASPPQPPTQHRSSQLDFGRWSFSLLHR